MGAFDNFENAILFISDNGNFVKNTDGFGNSQNDAPLISIRCYIKQISLSQLSPLAREIIEKIPIQGRCISPVQFPIGFQSSTIVNGIVDSKNYRVKVIPSLLSPMYAESAILGQKFTGELLDPIVWGNA